MLLASGMRICFRKRATRSAACAVNGQRTLLPLLRAGTQPCFQLSLCRRHACSSRVLRGRREHCGRCDGVQRGNVPVSDLRQVLSH